MLDVLAVGNALIDEFLSIHKASIHCHLREKECELAFALGEKIPLDHTDVLLGGNASNVAVGIKRLGFSSGLVAEIGKDPFAEMIKRGLRKEAIDISHVVETDTRSSFAVGIHFQQERILFVEHEPRKHEFQLSDIDAKWLYITSMGREWHHVYDAVHDYALMKGAKIAFSPGTLQLEEPETLRPMLQVTELLFLNKEEGQRLVGEAIEDPALLLSTMKKLGPHTVVMTDGKNGSYVLDNREELYHLGICDGPVVEKTGAGDSYASGFLAAHMLGLETHTAMKWGTVNASHVITKVGSQPGLLNREEVEQSLREHKDLIAKKI